MVRRTWLLRCQLKLVILVSVSAAVSVLGSKDGLRQTGMGMHSVLCSMFKSTELSQAVLAYCK